MKKILIIGATSSIAKATARIYAEHGDHLFLVARKQDQLERIAKDLEVRGASKIDTFRLDVNDFDSHIIMLDAAFSSLGKIDVVLIAHGSLGNQSLCEKSVDLTMREMTTNALSVIALLTHLANRFEQQKHGTIAVISSVAGDRGRQSNYVYGSAKAMVSTFTSGLRQRLAKTGVNVVTIKPGFVDTPMTGHIKKNFLFTSPDHVANQIVRACDNKNGEIYTPNFWRLIMRCIQFIPEKIFVRMAM